MGRRSPRAIFFVAFVVASLALGSTAAPVARVASAAGGGGNASINLTKTIGAVAVTPTLGLGLTVDKPAAIPGDTLTYTATLTNTGANLKLTGTFVAQNSSIAATVAADYDYVEYFSIQANAWVPLAGAAANQAGYTPVETAPVTTGLSLAATGRPTAGVTYGSGADHIVGTAIGASKTATWDYTATILLSPAQLALLLDPAKVSKIRNVVHFEVTPRALSVGQPFTFKVDFISQLRAGNGTVTNATITITPPSGPPAVFDKTTIPTLASIPSGAVRTVQSSYVVPAVAPKGASETDADYVARLRTFDGRTLTAKADASGIGGGVTITAPQQTVTTTERLPILSIDKTGPATVDAGTTITYDVALGNSGSAPASGLVITDALPGGATGTVSDVPVSIAPAGSATAHAAYDVPTTQAEGPLADTASVTWKDANGNIYGPLSDTFTSQVQNTLVGAHLTLSPATAGPLVVGSEHTLTATLTDRNNAPVSGQVIQFAVTGPNATTGSATTNASGVATFSYEGDNAGTDQAQATATKNATTVQSNTASASWIAPIQPVSITSVHGNFYPNTGVAHFTATPASTPVFGQDFPTIDFNPPAGTVLNNISAVDTTTRPFTDLTTDINGNYTGSIVAQGNGHQAGVADLTHFDAAFSGSFVVTQASDVTFNVFSDAGFILGVGGGANRVNGAFENPPASGTTPFQAFPVVGAYNLDSAPAAHPVTIHFPAPGTYPFEIDYFECCDSQLSLTLTTVSFIGDTSPLSVYVGYADGLRPGGSVFPFPWKGAPGVTFIGDNGTYDAGAVRFDNSSDAPIVLDSVFVDIAGVHHDIWGRNLTVPAHETLIATQTAQFNFDTSDDRGTTCTPIGTIPHVRVTIAGVTTTYDDTNQILNTKDIDLAACPGGPNESHAWERIGGGGTPVNHALPPAAALAIDPNTASATVGLGQSFTITAMDASGHPVADLPVNVQIFGVNTKTLTGTTDAAGIVTVSYIGTSSGKDQVQARAFVTGMLAISDVSTITWTNPLIPPGDPGGGTPSPFPPPSIGSVTPADGATVTEPVVVKATITPPAGETITDWNVTYQRAGTTGMTEIASGTGAPPATLATFDPTVLPNGTYLIAITANASNGGFQTSTTTLAVDGNLKLGRYTTTYEDLSVGVGGLPMQVRRTYDSFDKSVGDFGVGWRVEVANFRVSTGRALGLGGWTMYNKQCFFGLCITGFTSSIPHVVTVTWPDGHQEMFDLTPDGGSNIFWTGAATFTARARSTSTLAVDGSNEISFRGDGNLYAGSFGSSTLFDPQRFRLTAKDGTVYVLDRSGGLVSATTRNGDTLAVSSTGVTSSRGPSITFHRDSLGRIDHITGPDGEDVAYTFDPDGNLATYRDQNDRVVKYSYDGDHNLQVTRDALDRPILTLVYDPDDGRLVTVRDGEGNETTISSDPDARTETVIAPGGRLVTTSEFDTRGNTVKQTEGYDGKTAVTSFTYDAFDNVKTRTDPLGHTWQGVWDERSLTSFTAPGAMPVEITYDDFGYPKTWKQPGGATTTYNWDASTGNLVSIKDALLNTESYGYTGGDMTSRTDREQHAWTYEYASGRVTKVTEPSPLSTVTTYTYWPSGFIKDEKPAAGPITHFEYWPDGQVKSRELLDRTTSAPLGLKVSSTYDELGRLETRTDEAGKVTTWTYDLASRVVQIDAPLGKQTRYTYYPDGALETMTQENGANDAVTRYTYDGAGRMATMTDPENRTTLYRYDLAGRLVDVENPAHGITAYEYYDNGLLKLTRDPLLHETLRTYTPNGQLETVKDARGHTTRYEYDPNGRLTSVIDAATGETVTGYDKDGRVTSTQQPGLPAATVTYDEAGRVKTVRDPLGHATTNTYTSGRLTSVADALGHPTSWTYDEAGRMRTETTASGIATTFAYDPRGMVSSVKDVLGNEVVRTYNDLGLLSTERDARQNTTEYGYDLIGRLTLIKDAKLNTVTIGYDRAGQQTSITDGRNKTWSTTYAPLGGVETTTDPLGRSSSRIYDAAGQLTKLTDARGIVLDYGYDANGNVASVTSGPESVTYGYDELDRRRTMTDATGTTNWDFDPASRLTGVESPSGDIGYAYDGANRRISMTLPTSTVQYGYYDDDRLASTTIGSATTNFTYELDGRPKTVSRPNGVVTSYGYDPAGRLTSVNHARGGTAIAGFTYTLDENGNRRSMTTAGGTETYTLDAVNQLTGVSGPSGTAAYTYDAAGNRQTATVNGTGTTYTYDDASQLVSAGATNYTYDGAGNRLTAGPQTYTYDRLGRLATERTGGITTTFTNDGDGNRVAATTGGTTTPYLWDLAAPLAELVSDGSATYIHGNGQLLAESRSAATTYPLEDAIGSIRAITDGAGAVTGTAAYDPFGGRTAQSGAGSVFGFAGEQTDPAGLVYLRARSLDPVSGTFTQVDALRPGAPGVVGYNPYTYAGSNPTTFTDPSGHGIVDYALQIAYEHPTAVLAFGLLATGCVAYCANASRGIAGALIALAYALQRAGSGTTTWPGTGVGNPPTVKLPSFDDVVNAIKDAAKVITKATAAAIALECAARAAGLPIGPEVCSGKVFVTGSMPVPGGNPEATKHDVDAIAMHPLIWLVLTRGANSEAPDGSEALAARGWYKRLPQCQAKDPGQDCDEYPFYSTRQGGPAIGGRPAGDVKPINSRDNQSQGSRLGLFYRWFNVTDGTPFLVLALDDPLIPTFGFDASP